jgi:hypothetical protein
MLIVEANLDQIIKTVLLLNDKKIVVYGKSLEPFFYRLIKTGLYFPSLIFLRPKKERPPLPDAYTISMIENVYSPIGLFIEVE